MRWLRKLPAAVRDPIWGSEMLLWLWLAGFSCGLARNALAAVVTSVLGGLLLVLIGLKAYVLVLKDRITEAERQEWKAQRALFMAGRDGRFQ
jgi:hypothetical protein